MKLIHGGDIYTKRDLPDGYEIIDFSANINPLGMPPKAREAIVNNIDSFMPYPDPMNRELREAIAMADGIDMEHIVCGNGAADIIFRLALALKPKKALVLAPTFAEYEIALNSVGTDVEHFLLKEENGFILDERIFGAINRKTDVVFICNPNNPTGVLTSKVVLQKILAKCEKVGAILVIDECFLEFSSEFSNYTMVDELKISKNLFILKAFTKMYSMAGIRLGYGLSSNEDLMAKINSTGQPWAVSTVASKCGVAALSEEGFVEKTVEYITVNRRFLEGALSMFGFKVYPSSVNYILFESNIENLGEKMARYGILIRSCANYKGLSENHYRIAVRSMEDNAKFIATLKIVLGGL